MPARVAMPVPGSLSAGLSVALSRAPRWLALHPWQGEKEEGEGRREEEWGGGGGGGHSSGARMTGRLLSS